MQTQVRLGAAGTTEIVFFLGQAATGPEAEALLAKYREADLDAVLGEVTQQWDETLGAVQVKTPDRALDILLNRWLPYQTLACRVWARTGFYQASGAYGFRDQLQDVMALCVSRPDIAREHLLRAAARQFVEGDVQHWWLPESGRGIRTRVSDDRVWLAYAVAHYVEVTGDLAVLDEMVPFLEGPVLRDGRARCVLPADDFRREGESVRSLRAGARQESGDRRARPAADGNRRLERRHGPGRRRRQGRERMARLVPLFDADLLRGPGRAARQSGARDGVAPARGALEGIARTRRAGTATGIAAPISTMARRSAPSPTTNAASIRSRNPGPSSRAPRSRRAPRAPWRRWTSTSCGATRSLSLLFTPPFDHPTHDPGYIKGYPPGIRENGGQYTHGAVWAALAFAMQGDGDKAGELLSMLNPIHHCRQPLRRSTATRSSPTSSAPTSIPSRRMSGAADGPGTRARPAGCTAWRWNGFSDSAFRGRNLVLDPCIPRGWPGFEIAFRYRSARYEISVENPLGVCRGILAIKLDGEMLTEKPTLLVPLVDDGATHSVQVVLG